MITIEQTQTMNFNIAINNYDSINIICPNHYMWIKKYMVTPNDLINTVKNNIDYITRNNEDNKNYVLVTIDRCDIILLVKDDSNITGIALIQLDFNGIAFICGMYTSETNEKKYGTYLMNTIKYICKNINVKKITLSPIDNNVTSFYEKNYFITSNQDNFYYFDL